MMNRHSINRQEGDLEELALHYSFEDLAEQDRGFVLDHLGSADAYSRLRRVLLQTRTALKNDPTELSLPSDLREHAHAALHRGRRSRPGVAARLSGFFSLSVPAYSVPAAIVMAVVLLFGSGIGVGVAPSSVQVITLPVVTAIPVTRLNEKRVMRHFIDTLTGQRKEQKEALPLLQANRRSPVPVAVGGAANVALLDSHQVVPHSDRSDLRGGPDQTFVGMSNLPHLKTQRRGRSMVEDSLLMEFGTVVRDTF